jgi:hypothetical protein
VGHFWFVAADDHGDVVARLLHCLPKEEIPMIAYQMSSWHLLGLFIVTVLVMHIFAIAGRYWCGGGETGYFRIIK